MTWCIFMYIFYNIICILINLNRTYLWNNWHWFHWTTSGNKTREWALAYMHLPFSKWPVTIPLPSKEASIVALSLIKVFSTYGFLQKVLNNYWEGICKPINFFILIFIQAGQYPYSIYIMFLYTFVYICYINNTVHR